MLAAAIETSQPHDGRLACILHVGRSMSRSAVLASILLALAPAFATADVPVIQNTSLVRVRADNRFGVAKQHDLMPFVGMDTSDAISDTEAEEYLGKLVVQRHISDDACRARR